MARPKKQPPPSGTKDRRTEMVVIGLILVASAGLILANLGNIYLWQDEAQTALVSRTVLTHGIPLGYDGKNHFSQEQGAEYGKSHVWRWHAWLPFYVLAGFFAAFGTSNFVCRLPFALFGIGAVLLTYWFGKSLWRCRRAGILAASALIVSVPFLLLVRQCRYYSPAAFFSLAALYSYHEMQRGRRWAAVAFAASSFLLFHTFYIYLPAVLGAAIIHSAIFRRDKLKLVLVISAVVVAVNIPWVVFFSAVAHGSRGATTGSQMVGLWQYYLAGVPKHIFPPAMILLLVAVIIAARIRGRKREKPSAELAGDLVLLLSFVALTIAILGPTAPGNYFRYLAPVIPVFALISGRVLDSGIKLHPSLAIIALATTAWMLRMPSYLYEITHDYDGPIEGIVTYLNDHADKDDAVVVNHEDLPVAFYTNLRVISCTTGEDISGEESARWLVLRLYVGPDERKFTDYLIRKPRMDDYETIPIPYPDIANENREDPDEHLFRTADAEDEVIIRRKLL